MQWFGKAIGAALGLAVGGPWGGVVGAMLGHQFDQGLGSTVTGGGARSRDAFFATTFEVMGHVAKIDGRVSEEEIQIARRIMHAMHLGPEEVRLAIGHFTTGKQPGYPMQRRIDELARRIGQRRELSRTFVQIQVQAVVGAGEVGQAKRELLWVIARSLGLSRVELAQIEAAFRGGPQGSRSTGHLPDLGDAYRTLGIEAAVSDREVKTAYRRLMNQHHPDKLVSRGLPESMISVAEERTQQIRAAYDRIKSERGFR